MPLRVHNTMTRRKEAFEPADPSHVRMYVCGPTVYDRAHIGNARPVVVFDVLNRLLRHLYPRVTYVRNLTDIDDKIIDAARENGEHIDDLTARTIEAFHDDMAALGATPPDVEPRCTRTVPEMVEMIETLVASGNAYEAEGHVLFNVPSWKTYGKLSRQDRDAQIAGARVEVAPYKKDPADFVMWKPSTADQPGWDSPWGKGRPGWHIECSAMAKKHLGVTFDIHGGGQDLIFPHHENEIAQSECAHDGAPFANYWMHNGYLMAEGEKMSKSLGNFYTVRELLDEGWDGEVIRLVLLSTHYRQPLDFTHDKLTEAKAALDRFYTALRQAPAKGDDVPPPVAVIEALSDDLNTPLALSALHEAVSVLNKANSEPDLAAAKGALLAGAALLGLLDREAESWFKGAAAARDADAIDALIAARNKARTDKDFAEADRIRDELKSMGVELEDGPGGTTWKMAG